VAMVTVSPGLLLSHMYSTSPLMLHHKLQTCEVKKVMCYNDFVLG